MDKFLQNRDIRRLIAAFAVAFASGGVVHAGPAPPLVLEQQVPLPGVQGRIDHLALDREGRRLFVAALGAGAVEVVDLRRGRVTGRIGGLREPQGLAYLPSRDELAAASGGDGSVSFYRARDLAQIGRVRLGEDADDVRIDPASGQVVVGYGRGGLAAIDPARFKVTRTVRLPVHPEAFAFDRGRVLVNLPEADEIAALDLRTGARLAAWRDRQGHLNFPMAIDLASGRLAVAYRLPSRLGLLDAASGKPLQDLATCGDADDVWFGAGGRRIYVVCGSGAVDVFASHGGAFAREAHVPTRPGARTGLYDPVMDRLFVAAPARGGEPAAIWTFRPQPAQAPAPASPARQVRQPAR